MSVVGYRASRKTHLQLLQILGLVISGRIVFANHVLRIVRPEKLGVQHLLQFDPHSSMQLVVLKDTGAQHTRRTQ